MFVVQQMATQQNGTDLYIIIYNSLAQKRSSIIHLPVSSQAFYSIEEIGGTNQTLTAVSAIPALHGSGGAKYRVVFSANNIPPMGAKMYKVSMAQMHGTRKDVHAGFQPHQGTSFQRRRLLSKDSDDSDIVASNEYYSVAFDR